MKSKLMVISLIVILCMTHIINISAQRAGRFPLKAVTKTILLTDGPKGPVKGGESSVTDMVLAEDGFVYGSTKAVLGAKNCHLFRQESCHFLSYLPESINPLISFNSLIKLQYLSLHINFQRRYYGKKEDQHEENEGSDQVQNE